MPEKLLKTTPKKARRRETSNTFLGEDKEESHGVKMAAIPKQIIGRMAKIPIQKLSRFNLLSTKDNKGLAAVKDMRKLKAIIMRMPIRIQRDVFRGVVFVPTR